MPLIHGPKKRDCHNHGKQRSNATQRERRAKAEGSEDGVCSKVRDFIEAEDRYPNLEVGPRGANEDKREP